MEIVLWVIWTINVIGRSNCWRTTLLFHIQILFFLEQGSSKAFMIVIQLISTLYEKEKLYSQINRMLPVVSFPHYMFTPSNLGVRKKKWKL